MKLFAQIARAISVFVVAFVCWYVIASDYGDAVTSGTYSLVHGGERSTLVLRPDHTFTQEVRTLGQVRQAVGAWHRSGEGGVELSKEFLALPGQEQASDGTSHADLENGLVCWFVCASGNMKLFGTARPILQQLAQWLEPIKEMKLA